MPESGYQLPPDSTGKTIRTRKRVVSGSPFNSVEEQYVIAALDAKVRTGIYYYGSAVFSINAGADSSSISGPRFWLVNPTGSAVLIAVRRIDLIAILTSTTQVANTATRMSMRKGTAVTVGTTPTSVSSQKRATSDAAAVGVVYTGLGTSPAVTAGGDVATFLMPSVLTAVGVVEPTELSFDPVLSDEWVVLAAGECLYCTQIDAGLASEANRKFSVTLSWEEYTIP